jgi:hypothetical protein
VNDPKLQAELNRIAKVPPAEQEAALLALLNPLCVN